MKKKLFSILTAWVLSMSTMNYAWSKETITVQFSANATQPNSVPYLKMLEVANQLQKKYEFVLEFKPGANGILALKAMDQQPENRLATVAPAFVENARTGQINESDYAVVATQGDACWAVITNVGDTNKGLESLRGQKEITVGGTGYGNAAHLTALIIGEKYGFNVRYIVYKANFDALVNMAAGEKINFVLERPSNFKQMKEKNPNLQILGINCANRSPLFPNVKTVREQGFTTPTIFMSTVANVKMPESKRREIAQILDDAQEKLGAAYLLETADMNPPQFNRPKISTQEFFNTRVNQMKDFTSRYQAKIDAAK